MSAPPAVEIVWDRGPGGETCIDGRELAPKVEATLGRPVSLRTAEAGSAASPQSVALDGVLQGQVQPRPDGRGWIAVVEVRRANTATLRREVTLEAPDCRQLDEAIVLVVALMAEAAQPGRSSPPPPASPPVHSPFRPVIAFGPDVTAVSGMVPRIALGLGLAGELALPSLWTVTVWAHAWPTSQVVVDGGGGRISAWTAGTALCLGTPGESQLAVMGCAGASAGAISSSGIELDDPRTSVHPYVQGQSTVGMRVRMGGPVYVRIELGFGIPVFRDSYHFTDALGTVHQVFHTAAVIPLGRLGFEFQAPL